MIDRQDVLTVLGLGLLHAGVAFIYWPAALILGGLFCLLFVVFLERARMADKPKADSGPVIVRRNG